MRGVFVTGTDTGVGKTALTAALCAHFRELGLRCGVYKPAVSGSEPGPDGAPVWGDVERLFAAAGGEYPRERVCPQRFRAALAPPVAARREGRSVDSGLLRSGAAWFADRAEVLLVEGAGGLLCPLTDTETMADLAVDLGWPILIVARRSLGTLNHSLLTVEAAERRGLRVAAVVLNSSTESDDRSLAAETNAEELSRRIAPIPVVCVPWCREGDLRTAPQFQTINWRSLID